MSTFAPREAAYGLDHVADLLFPGRATSLCAGMAALMVAVPRHWERHLTGDADHCRRQRHHGQADRLRHH